MRTVSNCAHVTKTSVAEWTASDRTLTEPDKNQTASFTMTRIVLEISGPRSACVRDAAVRRRRSAASASLVGSVGVCAILEVRSHGACVVAAVGVRARGNAIAHPAVARRRTGGGLRLRPLRAVGRLCGSRRRLRVFLRRRRLAGRGFTRERRGVSPGPSARGALLPHDEQRTRDEDGGIRAARHAHQEREGEILQGIAAEEVQREQHDQHCRERIHRPRHRLQQRDVHHLVVRLVRHEPAVLADPVEDDDRIHDRVADDGEQRREERIVGLAVRKRVDADHHDDVVQQRDVGDDAEAQLIAEAECDVEQLQSERDHEREQRPLQVFLAQTWSDRGVLTLPPIDLKAGFVERVVDRAWIAYGALRRDRDPIVLRDVAALGRELERLGAGDDIGVFGADGGLFRGIPVACVDRVYVHLHQRRMHLLFGHRLAELDVDRGTAGERKAERQTVMDEERDDAGDDDDAGHAEPDVPLADDIPLQIAKEHARLYAPYQTGWFAMSLSTTTSVKARVMLTAVNSENTVPTSSVSAKPLTVPVPSQYSTAAPTIVVTCESKTVVKARLKPTPTAARVVRPAHSSSLMRSKISTFASTAIPMESTNPAMPGSVSTTPKYVT